MIDISKKDILEEYLRDKNIMSDCLEIYIRFFGGGVSGTVAFVSDGKRNLIVKQALPKLKVKDDWQCDPKRMRVEFEAQEIYSQLVPHSVPKPILYDNDNFIMIREAAAEDCCMWKSNLMDGIFNFKIADMVIQTLLTVHNKAAVIAEIDEKFSNNQYFYDLRISPYIERVAEIYPELKAKAQIISQKLLQEKITLVHGDFSPKNILVTDDGVCLLDFEVAHKGHPAFDLAFFSNHFILKAVKNKKWFPTYLNMFQYMLSQYFSGVTCMDVEKLQADMIELLPFMMLARIDGKSPAEYITSENDKRIIRDLAGKMFQKKLKGIKEVNQMIEKRLKEEEAS